MAGRRLSAPRTGLLRRSGGIYSTAGILHHRLLVRRGRVDFGGRGGETGILPHADLVFFIRGGSEDQIPREKFCQDRIRIQDAIGKRIALSEKDVVIILDRSSRRG